MSATRQKYRLFLGRATPEARLGNVSWTSESLLFFSGRFVEGNCLSLLDGERPSRTNRQTKACPITQLLIHHAGFPIHDRDSALNTGGNAEAAAVT